jgi:hypothetical protein
MYTTGVSLLDKARQTESGSYLVYKLSSVFAEWLTECYHNCSNKTLNSAATRRESNFSVYGSRGVNFTNSALWLLQSDITLLLVHILLSLLPLLLSCSHNIWTSCIPLPSLHTTVTELPVDTPNAEVRNLVWRHSCSNLRSFTPACCSSSKWHPTYSRFTGSLAQRMRW